MSDIETMDHQDLELLAGRVLGDLTEPESVQVESILARSDSTSEILFELDRAAAGVQLTLIEPDFDPMPVSLAERIRSDGRRRVGSAIEADSSAERLTTSATRAAEVGTDQSASTLPVTKFNRRETLAWLSAAAALLIALGLWVGDSATSEKSANLLRDELIRSGKSLIQVDWTAGKTPFDQSVSGDVVWDAESQRGYMRFENMPINDPTVEQYQLWIIDPKRDDEPIDGGVFDITESGEVVIEIDAKLQVIDPAAFAITIEQPGGVVVSTQERLPLLAAVDA